jgi:hypothetical protein
MQLVPLRGGAHRAGLVLRRRVLGGGAAVAGLGLLRAHVLGVPHYGGAVQAESS